MSSLQPESYVECLTLSAEVIENNFSTAGQSLETHRGRPSNSNATGSSAECLVEVTGASSATTKG